MKRIIRQNLAVTAIAAVLLATPLSATGYELTILHINDHHSHLKANNLDLKLAGKRTRLAIRKYQERNDLLVDGQPSRALEQRILNDANRV